ncbi:MAG TPA: fibronectin type III domain-containing protein [Chitinophagales bacterium]|nr:fibronectin type III domain-containing protein [Chitinophagales bacterium]
MGGNSDDILYAIHQTNDEAYVFGGYSRSGISPDKSEANRGNYDYWVVKLDPSGNIIWDKTAGGNGDDQLEDIRVTADGGYICAGYSGSGLSGDKSESSKGGYDYWVVKLGCTSITWFADNDGDGFGNPDQDTSSCSQPSGYVTNGGDCDDESASVNPTQPENPDGIDDNCDGNIDEGFCIIPTQLATDEITATSARFNWTGNGEADKYKLRYSGPALPTTTVTVSDPLATSYVLTGLQPSTTYNWRVQSVCGSIHTDFSKKKKFTTAAMRVPAGKIMTDPAVFPNPFSNGISISFYLKEPASVQINLLNVEGNLLATTATGNLDAGNHVVAYLIPEAITGNIFFIQLINGAGEVNLLKLIRQ